MDEASKTQTSTVYHVEFREIRGPSGLHQSEWIRLHSWQDEVHIRRDYESERQKASPFKGVYYEYRLISVTTTTVIMEKDVQSREIRSLRGL